MQPSFEHLQRRIIPQPPWATCAVFDHPYFERIKKCFPQYLTGISVIITHVLLLCTFQRSLTPPFLLSAFPYVSCAPSLLLFWWPSSGLALPCQRLSGIVGPSLDTSLRMKSHKCQCV